MKKEKQIIDLLDGLESELRSLQLWQSTPPSAEALSSQEPFSLDTLAPQEWLQWIFIMRMRALLKANQPLPSGFAMAAYFEESWKERPELAPALQIIQQIDKADKHA